MKAIIYNKYGSVDVLEYREISIPTIARDQVLIKVHYAAVNPKDCFVRKGKFKFFTGNKFPMQLGHDLAGEIIETGKAVTNFDIGDEVYGMINGWKGMSYAEFVAVEATEITKKPKSISFAESAAVPLAGMTALQALRNLGRIKRDMKICINGASGGVGSFAIQIAKSYGAIVTAICSHRNFDLCHNLGADFVWDYTKNNISNNNGHFNIFFDVFGNMSFSRVKHLLLPTAIYISTVPNLINFWHYAKTFFFSKKKAKFVNVQSNRTDLTFLSELIDSGRIKPIIEKEYPLEKAHEAHLHIQTKHTKGKNLLKI